MSLKNCFLRNKKVEDVVTSDSEMQKFNNKIECDTVMLRKLITSWTQNEGWNFENFADFIELIGEKTPVKLSELDEKNNSFNCVTALDKKISISLLFGDYIDFSSEIHVTDGNETKRYIINSNFEKGKSVPKITLQGRNIKIGEKELNSYYCEFFCHRILKIDDMHVLEIEIYEPNKYDNKSKILVLQNCEGIEEYLLGLGNSLVVDEVYEKMMEFLNFSNDDILKCKKVLISYMETFEKEKRVRAKILLINGKKQEYAILENGETFHIFKDGRWNYLSDSGIRIVYNGNIGNYIFSMTGSEYDIVTVNPRETIKRVKERISKLLNL